MRKIVSTVLAAIILAAAVTAHAHGRARPQGEVSVEIVSDQGSALITVPHKDFWSNGTRTIKKYLEARRGENYGIVIRNTTPERIGVVMAVDGRNIVSGKRSDLSNTEDMYIVEAFGNTRYDGWRTDNDTVHRYRN